MTVRLAVTTQGSCSGLLQLVASCGHEGVCTQPRARQLALQTHLLCLIYEISFPQWYADVGLMDVVMVVD